MQDRLADAFFFERHNVLGVDLVPFTLRHAFLLAIAENPLTEGGRIPCKEDLRQAVLVCSRPAEEVQAPARLGWFQRCKLDARTITARLEDFRQFADYINDHCSAPLVWSKGEGRKCKAHWAVTTAVGLMYHLGYSKEDAWNETPGQAQWLLALAAEQNPHAEIDILSDGEAAYVEKLKEGRVA